MKRTNNLTLISTALIVIFCFMIFVGGGHLATAVPSRNLRMTASFTGDKPRIAYVNNWQIHIMDGDGTQNSCLTCNLNLTEATAPAWSPDRRHIAFKMLTAENSWAIAIVDVDGRNLRRIADYDIGNPDISEDPPAWSPDGTKIAYATYREGQWGIFVNAIDGSNEHRLTYNTDWVIEPSWSPSGQNIAFTSFNGLMLINPHLAGTGPQVYAQGKHVSSLTWSPDNARITFTSDDGLFVIGADGSNPQRLADWGESAVWSPDGGQIAFVTTPESSCGCKGVETIEPNGSSPHLLYRGAGIVDSPAWSPDSKQLLFIANSDSVNDSWYNSDIYLINSDGSQLQHLAKGWSPTWSS